MKLIKNFYGNEKYPDENDYDELKFYSYDLYETLLFGGIAYFVFNFIAKVFL